MAHRTRLTSNEFDFRPILTLHQPVETRSHSHQYL